MTSKSQSDESLSVHLRLLSACELYLNADYYSNHPKLVEAQRNPQIMSTNKKTLFSVLLTEQCEGEDSLQMCVKKEAAGMCRTKKWSSMLQVLSLANVLKTPVYSVYPDTSLGIRPLLNGVIQCFNSLTDTTADPFVVMWSRDGNLDSRPGSVFQQNHFVLLQIIETQDEIGIDMKRKAPQPKETYKKRAATLPGRLSRFQSRAHITTNASNAKQPNIMSFFKKQNEVNKEKKPLEQIIYEKGDASDQSESNVKGLFYDDAKIENATSANANKVDATTYKPDINNNEQKDKHDYKEYVTIEQGQFEESRSQCEALCCASDERYRPVSDSELKASARVNKNRSRSCQLSWFEEFQWLSYCTTNNRVYCSKCRYGHRNSLIKFSTKSESTFIIEGFNNWKKSPMRLREHKNSETHREVKKKMAFLTNDTNVQHEITKQNKEEQDIRQKCLLNQLQSLKFLLRQGLAIRGKIPDEGNFSQLQNLRALDNTHLSEWIEKKNYQSPAIVNEQIKLLGHHFLRLLMTRIATAKYYSVLADETRDISNKEQLSISVRWVDETFNVHEDFVGLVQLDATDAVSIFNSIKDVLLRLCLPLNFCRGQGYDGASNFMGKINGAAVRIRNEVPQAIVVHCFAHCLNLSLQDSCRNVSSIRGAIDLVKEIASLIKWSPKRQVLFEKIQSLTGNSSTKIKPLCPTRWTVRTVAISSVLENYAQIVETMETVNATGNDDYSRRAGGVASLMQKFSTFYGLNLSHLLFSATEQLSTTLQGKDTCIQDAKIGHTMVTNFFERQRTDNAFDIFYKNIEDKALSLTDAPCLPRYRKVPKRIDSGQENFKFTDPKQCFRQQYFEAIDNVKNQLDRRFANKEIGLVHEIERILIESANGKPVSVPNEIKVLYKDDLDFEKLDIQLKLMPDMVKVNSIGVQRVTCVRTICELINQQPGQNTFMSEIAKMVKVYLTIPVTTATAERSFSTLRRLKTYLRSTMTQERLNNTMLLHCYKDEIDQVELLDVAKDFVAKSSERISYFGKF